jgi:putative flippase GtrA
MSEARRFTKFAIVGAIGFVVDAGTFYIFSRIFGLTLLVAQALSFTVAVANNYFWNRYWTFPEARSKSFHRQMVQFYVTSLAGLVIRSITIALIEVTFERLAEGYSPLSLPPKLISDYASLTTAIIIVTVWNYVINRLWTFREAS